MLSFSLTNLPLSMYVVDDLPRRYFASRQIPLPLIFTGNGACRPRPRRKPEMNFCSTVICSLFRCSGKFFPVPLLSGTLISVPLFRAPKTGHRKNCVCFEKHPCFWAGKFAPAPKMSYLCTVNRATHIFCPHVVTIAAS